MFLTSTLYSCYFTTKTAKFSMYCLQLHIKSSSKWTKRYSCFIISIRSFIVQTVACILHVQLQNTPPPTPTHTHTHTCSLLILAPLWIKKQSWLYILIIKAPGSDRKICHLRTHATLLSFKLFILLDYFFFVFFICIKTRECSKTQSVLPGYFWSWNILNYYFNCIQNAIECL